MNATAQATGPRGAFKPKDAKADPKEAAASWLRSVGGTFHDAPGMASTRPPPLDWVYPGHKAGTVKSLVSTGGVGKSFLSLGLAASIASGVDVLGLYKAWGVAPTRGKVVFLALEDDQETIHHRLSLSSKTDNDVGSSDGVGCG